MIHFFVTGPSGAGKTIVAKTLAAEILNLPLIQLDKDERWTNYLQRQGEDWLQKGQSADYYSIQQAIVADALLAAEKSSVLEGRHLLATPELLTGGVTLLVLPLRSVVVKQRVQRNLQKAQKRGGNFDFKKCVAAAEFLYDEALPECQRLLQVVPNAVHLREGLNQLRQVATELDLYLREE